MSNENGRFRRPRSGHLTQQMMKELQKYLQCSIPAGTLFPSIIFTSAATHKSYRRNGFNQLLRLYFLKYADQNNIKTLISPVYKDAPRISFMEQLGYKFDIPEKNWQNKLDPKSPRQLGLLTSDYFENAIEIINQYNQNLINDYPWYGDPIPFTVLHS